MHFKAASVKPLTTVITQILPKAISKNPCSGFLMSVYVLIAAVIVSPSLTPVGEMGFVYPDS
jgi:hypothetical protein